MKDAKQRKSSKFHTYVDRLRTQKHHLKQNPMKPLYPCFQHLTSTVTAPQLLLCPLPSTLRPFRLRKVLPIQRELHEDLSSGFGKPRELGSQGSAGDGVWLESPLLRSDVSWFWASCSKKNSEHVCIFTPFLGCSKASVC